MNDQLGFTKNVFLNAGVVLPEGMAISGSSAKASYEKVAKQSMTASLCARYTAQAHVALPRAMRHTKAQPVHAAT